MGLEINDAMSKLGITKAQAEALDAIDGKDEKIGKSVFDMAEGYLKSQTNQNIKFHPQDHELCQKVKDALNPLPATLSKESEQNLRMAGIDKEIAERINIREAHFENVSGQKYLVLRSGDNFELHINTSDKDYDPSKINFWRAEDECNVHIEGVSSGSLEIRGADYEAGMTYESTGFALHNSNISVRGADGVEDRIAVYEDGSRVDIKTKDYADTLEVRHKNGETTEIRLKAGLTEKNSKGEIHGTRLEE